MLLTNLKAATMQDGYGLIEDAAILIEDGRIIAAAQDGRGIINCLAQNEIVAFGTDGDTDGEYPWPATMELESEGWSSGGCRL